MSNDPLDCEPAGQRGVGAASMLALDTVDNSTITRLSPSPMAAREDSGRSVEPVSEASLWMFLRGLRASGLIADDELDNFERHLATESVEYAENMLTGMGRLTPYQAKCIKEGKTDSLIIGQYQILDELGQGGFGQVFKARHTLMDRIVALKIINQKWADDKMARAMFLREVAVATHLSHPNIALAFHADELDGRLFLAMEFVEGTTLEEYVNANGPLPFMLTRAIMLQAARALQCAHAHSVVHRDIKPANLMLPGIDSCASAVECSTTLVKVVDFGLARIRENNKKRLTTICCAEGTVVGTPVYMAPEQLRNVHDADIRSDLYSLGCTIYFALTKREPFDAIVTAEQYTDISKTIQTARPDVPTEFANIIQKLIARQPSKRFQTPDELIEALNGPLMIGRRDDSDILPAARDVDPENVLSSDDEAAKSLWQSARQLRAGFNADPQLPNRLPTLWSEWLDILKQVAAGHEVDIEEKEYHQLHQSLVQAILADPMNLPTPLDTQLLGVIEPWVHFHSLTAIDARSLQGVYDSCQPFDRLIRDRQVTNRSESAFPFLAASILLVLIAASFVVFRAVM